MLPEPMCDHICPKLDVFFVIMASKMTFCCFVVLVARRELTKKVTYFCFVALIFLVPGSGTPAGNELTGILRICGG